MNDDKRMLYNTKSGFWSRKITMFRNRIRNSAYPGRIQSLWMLIALVMGLHFAGKSYGLMNYLAGYIVIAE